MELLPNTLSFRMVVTIDVESESDVPAGFSGRVRHSSDGFLVWNAWYRNGKLDDPAPNTPAYVKYRRDGRPKQQRHYRLGRLHDPEPGTPAVHGYFANGADRYVEHYRYGRRHDSIGAPAIIKWRHDGSVRTRRHYIEGARVEDDADAGTAGTRQLAAIS